MKKKTVLFTVLFCLLTATVLTAQTPAPASDFAYDLNDAGTGIVIKRYTGSNPNLVIPQRIEGYPVIEIDIYWDRRNRDLIVTVVIPEGVKKIGTSAFAGLTNLQTVRLPNSVEIIGPEAFYNCKNLTQINIPANIKEIWGRAFADTFRLSNLIIPNSITSIRWVDYNGRGSDDSFDNAHFCSRNRPTSLPLATRQRLRDLGYKWDF